MIRLIGLLRENSLKAVDKIDKLPKGKIFDDSKNIESVFKKSKFTWSEVIEAFESNKDSGKLTNVNIKDIYITQPNIQSNKVKQIINNLEKTSPINVVQFNNGEMVIFDGHHRLMANWALGNAKLKVNLVKSM